MAETTQFCRLMVTRLLNGCTYNGWLVIDEFGSYGGSKKLEFRTTSEPKAASPVQLHDIPRIKRALEQTKQYHFFTFEYI